MRPSRYFLLASTILSGVAAVTLSPNAFAQSPRGDVLAQAAPAGQTPETGKKTPVKPQPPKPPAPAAAPHPPAPQASRPPAASAPRAPEETRKPVPPKIQPAQTTPPPGLQHPPGKPAPRMQPAQTTPPALEHPPGKPAPRMQPAQTTPPAMEHPPGKPAPRMQPAQTTPPPTQYPPGKPMTPPERRATPQVPGKPQPGQPQLGQRPAAGGPPPQTAPVAGKPQSQPMQPVVRRAPPPPGNPAAVPPPTQVINKGQFLAPKGQAPSAGINAVRTERREEHVGNQLIIREPDRTIIQEGGRTFIRHSEVDRFAVGARNVQVERRGNQTVTVVMRPDGVQIIDYSDADGRLIRRVRRDPNGREIVIIDNGFAGAQIGDVFLNLAPPVISIPRDRYIVDADRADEAAIYGVLIAPPIERIARRYTLEQVRYNEPLRAYMPRLDLEVNFETGSWQLTPDQVDRLSAIAEAINRAVQRNPREVFLIEGYTDAVGSDVDNLSLSDRRAESVAVALTEQFQVPAENLATQGYGKQFLKVPTAGAERANRRVAIRRITPLIDPDAMSQR
jgi:outer membrane protein OmpA-like peptidoglycan-associated protein